MSRHGRMYCAAVLIAWILVLPELSAQTNQQASGVHRLPLRVGVVIDESGSAHRGVLQTVLLQKSLDWVGAALGREGGDAFLVAFNDQIIVSTELVTDVAQLRRAAEQVRQIGSAMVLIMRRMRMRSVPQKLCTVSTCAFTLCVSRRPKPRRAKSFWTTLPSFLVARRSFLHPRRT